MNHLRIFEEFNKSDIFKERVEYIREVINNIKDICIPFNDIGVKVSTVESDTLVGMISNVIYNIEYINSYRDYYRSVMSKDIKDLSDLFYIMIDISIDKWDEVDVSYVVRYHELPRLVIDCLYHLENYMTSEGFKLKIDLYHALGVKDEYVNIKSVEELDKLVTGQIYRKIRIGFYI